VAAGRVIELTGPGRSTVRITLADGSIEEESGYRPVLDLLPPRGWRHQAEPRTFASWGKPRHEV
jgi:hypothetical protein